MKTMILEARDVHFEGRSGPESIPKRSLLSRSFFADVFSTLGRSWEPKTDSRGSFLRRFLDHGKWVGKRVNRGAPTSWGNGVFGPLNSSIRVSLQDSELEYPFGLDLEVGGWRLEALGAGG